MSAIPIGASVYGTGSGSSGPYGHVGIYIGDGKVIDSQTGGIIVSTMEEWLSWQVDTLDGKQGWLGWGWEDNNRIRGTTDDPNLSESDGSDSEEQEKENEENADENGNVTESSSRTGSWAWKHPHTDGSPVTYTPLAGDIEMHEVDFGYTQDKTVLHDITLYAKPGQKIAFVGSTGAGKTTITNLLNRFYDIQDGKIRFDGININKIKKDDLRHSLGMILQDTHLFSGTIMENIRFGKLDATDDEVIAAAKLANAHDFIMMMPDGYNTMIENDGEGLSQGQRQLLSIARAAVCDPPVLVMDEATSSIDTHTEALVQSGMDRLMEGRTVFVIAHRLSTVRNSNCIMVLDHGRIIERGTHDELIAAKGTYYQLYTGAFELE